MEDKLSDYYFHRMDKRSGSHSGQHYHSLYEIYYLAMGKCNYFIGDHIFEVESGDLVIIPSGTIHKTNYSSETHSRLLINFSDSYLPKKIKNAAESIGYIYRNSKTKKEVENIFEKIENEYMRADEYSQEALGCYTAQLLLLVIRNKEDNEIPKSENSLIDTAVKYIRENYMNDIKLSDASKKLSVSAEHLSRTFKKVTGFGFTEYLTLLRLQNAEYMLKNQPGISVGTVAYACGFNDSNYFSYKFKKAYGISPKKVKPDK